MSGKGGTAARLSFGDLCFGFKVYQFKREHVIACSFCGEILKPLPRKRFPAFIWMMRARSRVHIDGIGD